MTFKENLIRFYMSIINFFRIHKAKILLKKSAFTLAEVLITLMILGVIAVIVIPSTISNIKKHQTEVELKKAYSILTNTIERAHANTGDSLADMRNTLGNCSGGDCWVKNIPFVETYILPNVQYSDYCPRTKQCKDTSYPKFNDGYHGYGIILNNGMYFEFQTDSYQQIILTIDLNGTKQGPNIFGYDRFYYTLYKDANKFVGENGWGSACSSPTGANNGAWNNNSGCAKVIMDNGWKIPDNYPVHF